MAETAITVVQTVKEGVVHSTVSFDDTNDMKFANDGKTYFTIDNSAGTPDELTLTVVTPGNVDGNEIEDLVLTVGANDVMTFGPFKPNVYNQTSGDDAGSVLIVAGAGTYTDVTIRAFRG